MADIWDVEMRSVVSSAITFLFSPNTAHPFYGTPNQRPALKPLDLPKAPKSKAGVEQNIWQVVMDWTRVMKVTSKL